nr:putative late blight resistance protein homolog R1A-3 [Ipomoea trifida]
MSLEEAGESYLHDLINRSLVQINEHSIDGKVKSCNIHDRVHEVCVRKAIDRKALCIINDNHAPKASHWLSCQTSDWPITRASYGNCGPNKIHSVLYFGRDVFHSKCRLVYPCLKLLRVLDLSLVKCSQGIPREITDLVHLRYLALSTIGSLYEFQLFKLKNLVTLIVTSWMEKCLLQLPCDFLDLPQLRHMHVDKRCSQYLPCLVKKDLQTLYWLKVTSSHKKPNFGMVPNLRELGIFIEGQLEHNYLESLVYLHLLEKLKFEVGRVEGFYLPLGFPPNLKKLTLRYTYLPWKEMDTIGMLPHLEVLKLKDFACCGSKWETSKQGFQKLKALLISRSNLKHWNASSNNFRVLERIVLRYCWELKQIPQVELPNIESSAEESVKSSEEESVESSKEECGESSIEECVESSKGTATVDIPFSVKTFKFAANSLSKFAAQAIASGGGNGVTCNWLSAVQRRNSNDGGCSGRAIICLPVSSMQLMAISENLGFSSPLHDVELRNNKSFEEETVENSGEESVKSSKEESLGRSKELSVDSSHQERLQARKRVMKTLKNKVSKSLNAFKALKRKVLRRNANPFHVAYQTLKDRWELVSRKVFGQSKCAPRDYELIGKRIVLGCSGLPLAVVLIAGLLATAKESLDIWKDVAETLDRVDTYDYSNRISKVLSLSYNYLPSHLKSCFHYFGVFPEDSVIPVKRLINLWVAEEFLMPHQNMSLEEVAESYLDDLINRNLVQINELSIESKVKSCKVHDRVHEVCVREAITGNALCIINDNHAPKASRWLSVQTSYWPITQARYGNCTPDKIHSVLCFSKGVYHSKCRLVYPCLKFLRVLDLSLVKWSKCMPSEITNLVHLRYLALSTIGSLYELQFLKLKNLLTLIVTSWMEKCPLQLPCDVLDLPQLRHLHIDKRCSQYLPCLVKKNLQTLYWLKVASFDEKPNFGMVPNLMELGIYIEGQLAPSYLGSLVYLHLLEKLKFEVGRVERFYLPIGFPPNLKKLTLRYTYLPWKEMDTIGQLPHLEVLKLKDFAFCGSKWEPSKLGFWELKALLISRSNLKYWNANSNHFPVLERLVLRYCWELKQVPINFASIGTLKLIVLECCYYSLVTSAMQISSAKKLLFVGTTDFPLHVREVRTKVELPNNESYEEEIVENSEEESVDTYEEESVKSSKELSFGNSKELSVGSSDQVRLKARKSVRKYLKKKVSKSLNAFKELKRKVL